MREFEYKAKEYLVAKGHDPFSVCKTFERTKLMPRNKAREKVKKGNCSSALVFSNEYNPRGPSIKNYSLVDILICFETVHH